MYLRKIIWLLLWAPWIAHADSILVKDALKQLIERQESAALPSSTAHASDPASSSTSVRRRTESLLPSETLDGLIKRTWPGLPGKEVWVRRTFVDLNPKAFVQGNPNLLQPGSVMTIPTKEDLRASFSKAHPSIAALFEQVDVSRAETNNSEPNKSPSPRWVRFP